MFLSVLIEYKYFLFLYVYAFNMSGNLQLRSILDQSVYVIAKKCAQVDIFMRLQCPKISKFGS